MLSLQEIASILNAEPSPHIPQGDAMGFAFNSKDVKPGYVFFAIPGEKTHGIEYADDALERGAVLVISDRFVHNIPLLKVPNTLDAMWKLAKYRRKRLKSTVIGITGSVGKTTTKDLLIHVLEANYRVFGPVKSFNNHIGVPITILNSPENTEFLILELGSNHPGEIERLAGLALPNLCIITKIGKSHLEFFGTISAVAEEKASILKFVSSGPVWINASNKVFESTFKKFKRENVKITYYGLDKDAEINGKVLNHSATKMLISIRDMQLELQNRGLGFVENTLAVYGVADYLKIPEDKIFQKISEFPGTPMRMEVVKLNGLTIINDAYNSNPDSLANLLLSVPEDPKRRTIFILGDMLELGEISPRLHREMGHYFARSGHKVLVAIGHFAKYIYEGAKEKGVPEAYYFEDIESGVKFLKGCLRKDDIIVIKASRAMAFERIINLLKEDIV